MSARLTRVAAGGMGKGGDGLGLPLSERGRPSSRQALDGPEDGRPCWVRIGDEAIAGTVHAWRRDPATGQWVALVVAWVRSDEVRAREATGS